MSHDEIKVMKLMQERGLRVTLQRLLVLDAVCEGQGHTTIEEILERVKELDPSINLSTVYRALDSFCEIGVLVSGLEEGKGKIYEIAKQTPHHHLACKKCKKVFMLDHRTISVLFGMIEEEYDFKVQSEHLVLNGLCSECRPKNLTANKRQWKFMFKKP